MKNIQCEKSVNNLISTEAMIDDRQYETSGSRKTGAFKRFILELSTAVLLIFGIGMFGNLTPVYASDIESLLNSAELYPTLTLSEPTNYMIVSVLNQITTPNMTTYQKVLAIHDYLVATCSYGGAAIYLDENIMTTFASLQDYRAYSILSTHIGVCDHYTSAFVALTRAIGLDSYYTSGMTTKASGGYTGHAWPIIYINGEDYGFDAQIDDNLSKGGTISHARFGKKYSEVPGKYIPSPYYETTTFEYGPYPSSWF